MKKLLLFFTNIIEKIQLLFLYVIIKDERRNQMKLVGLKLKNFRRYKNIDIDLSQNLHMIVGINDIGKSTIFEALDIFFNGNNAANKLSIQDLNHDALQNHDMIIEISCTFSLENDEKVIIDSQFEVNPREEYLVNESGNIEITKIYNCQNKTIKPSILLNSYLPNCIDVSSWLCQILYILYKIKKNLR